jgi:hypothetical protein
MRKKVAKPSTSAKPGPKPDILKIDGNWEDAVKKSFQKKKPATGWPK